MNRREAEDFIYKSYVNASKHWDYTAKDSVKRKPELTANLLRRKSGTPTVVVTGSKGKGSVSCMLSQILQTRYKIGLMTGPHISDFCERFQINSQKITDTDFAKYMSMIQPEIEEIATNLPDNVCISPMGIQAALALTYFNAKQTEVNVIECGKGARYDDVNNISHAYAVINSIFLEHRRELGETVEDIAVDKAHVITGEQKCIYVADQPPSVLKIIEDRAAAFETPVKVYGRDFKAVNIRYTHSGMLFDIHIDDMLFHDISIPLLGEHQAKNCAMAMALSWDILGEPDLKEVKAKLADMDWQGRMEVISTRPFIVLDACIHAASCTNVKSVMKHLGIQKATIIIGIPMDKNYVDVAMEMQPVASHIILTKSQNPHYQFSTEQCERLSRKGIQTTWTDSVTQAINHAKDMGEHIVILGTTSVVAEVKAWQHSQAKS